MLSSDEIESIVRAQPQLRLVAIDGLPASGKSTLAQRLVAATGGASVGLDEFVKPETEWRWRDRPSFPFDYIRYDAFLAAVRALAADGRCSYRPYDWSSGRLAKSERNVETTRPVFVEGVSTLHPDLASLYGLRLWVESDAATTLQAVRRRGMGGWEREWEQMFLPSVALYLRTHPKARADLLVAGRTTGAGEA